MKKFLITPAAAFIGFAAIAQTNDYTIRQLRDPVQLQVKLNADIGIISNALAFVDSKIDTNTTTSVTTITPNRAGQILFGRVGSSNAIWRAAGATTNDWVKVLQAQ